MKIFLLAGVLFLSLSVVVFAQEGTATETLQGLESYAPALVALVTGYVSSILSKIFFTLGWLSTDSQMQLTKLVKLVIGAGIPAVLVVAINELAPVALYLDNSQLWPLVWASIAAAKGTHILDKFASK